MKNQPFAYILIIILLTTFALLCSCKNQPDTKVAPTLQTPIPSESPSALLEISELMATNSAYHLDDNGFFSDWIELHNISSASVNLSDFYLSDSVKSLKKFRLPDVTLSKDEYYLIFASGTNTGENHANFKIASEADTVFLSDGNENIISSIEFSNAEKNKSILQDGTTPMYATPGYENSDNGYIAYQNSKIANSGLIINEAMSMNSSCLPINEKYYDWVELKNNSSSPINLGNYYISNNNDNFKKCKLPDKILNPNELFCVICADKPGSAGDCEYFFTGFSLNGINEKLYITDSDSNICDYMLIRYTPYGTSYGREQTKNGFFYFTAPTPNQENTNGIRMVSEAPLASVQQGVIKDKTSIDVELYADGDIYYTTDGSVPTLNSKKYTEPIHIEKSTAIRSVAISEGKLKSAITNSSYIFDNQTTLPVLSLTVANDDLFGKESGIYVVGADPENPNYYKDLEKPASLTLFENGETVFSAGCGLKMFGTGSRADCEKKSLRVDFKSRYGQDEINCNLFNNGVTKFDTLILRGGEDTPRTLFRNELFTTLGKECMPNLLVQSSKFCTLYVNGEYWGIFCLKERFSDSYYSEHMNVSKSSVTYHQSPFDADTEMNKMLDYALSNDITQNEHYEYITKRLNIDSMIDFFILQAYSHNKDIGGNIRYFYSSEIGKWQYTFYDLDWAFFHTGNGFEILTNGEQYSLLIERLFKNDSFKDKFCKRLAYLLDSTLKDEHVLSLIDAYANLLRPEIPRERQRWPKDAENWENCVLKLKQYVENNDITKELIYSLKDNIGLSDSQLNEYFGNFIG